MFFWLLTPVFNSRSSRKLPLWRACSTAAWRLPNSKELLSGRCLEFEEWSRRTSVVPRELSEQLLKTKFLWATSYSSKLGKSKFRPGTQATKNYKIVTPPKYIFPFLFSLIQWGSKSQLFGIPKFFLNTHLGFSFNFTVTCHRQVMGGILLPSGGIVGENRITRTKHVNATAFLHKMKKN